MARENVLPISSSVELHVRFSMAAVASSNVVYRVFCWSPPGAIADQTASREARAQIGSSSFGSLFSSAAHSSSRTVERPSSLRAEILVSQIAMVKEAQIRVVVCQPNSLLFELLDAAS